MTVLDHHKTALETLCGNAAIPENLEKVIDMKRSGATIAFDFFREKLSAKGDASGDHEIGSNAVSGAKLLPDSQFERVHKLFKFVEDGDLWRWALPCSKAFSSGLKDLGIEYNVNVNPSLFHKVRTFSSCSLLDIVARSFMVLLKWINYSVPCYLFAV